MPIYALNGMRPTLPEPDRCWIAPGAHVIGQVVLEEDTSVWFGAVIRGDNDSIVIRAGSNIQDGALLHVDPGFPLAIGRNCTIGHHAVLHGCTIGDNTLIGMGATVLNGARVGAGCLVGANALVTEGKQFPDRSLIVGAPAKAIRELDENSLAQLSQLANVYIENSRRFRVSLQQL